MDNVKEIKDEYPSIKELFNNYTGDYTPEELSSNDRQGMEVI